MDHVPNGELHSLMKREGKMHEDVAKYFAAEILSILAYVHNKGFIHRDIKPSNFLLDENNHLKLVIYHTNHGR